MKSTGRSNRFISSNNEGTYGSFSTIYATPEDRQPVTIRIIFKEREELRPEAPKSPLVRVIHEDELAQMMESENESETREEELLTFGESVTLLIAIGVLIYLIYALLWPERF